jgi:hypothetical protein
MDKDCGFGTDSSSFPLTPALSLGEREKLLQHRVMPGVQEILQRGKSFPRSAREKDSVSETA